jgi:hypothetical protein
MREISRAYQLNPEKKMNSFTLKAWHETPLTLAEEMGCESVDTGLAAGRDFEWKGPTKEPFLTLAIPGPMGLGAIKREAIFRLEGERKVTVHFWETLSGERSHLKIKTS